MLPTAQNTKRSPRSRGTRKLRGFFIIQTSLKVSERGGSRGARTQKLGVNLTNLLSGNVLYTGFGTVCPPESIHLWA